MHRAGDLRQKEVVNIRDGARLGYVGDVDITLEEGRITAIIVPPRGGISRLFRDNEFVIPWEQICQIGEDIILVDIDSRSYNGDRRRI